MVLALTLMNDAASLFFPLSLPPALYTHWLLEVCVYVHLHLCVCMCGGRRSGVGCWVGSAGDVTDAE